MVFLFVFLSVVFFKYLFDNWIFFMFFCFWMSMELYLSSFLMVIFGCLNFGSFFLEFMSFFLMFFMLMFVIYFFILSLYIFVFMVLKKFVYKLNDFLD